MISTRERSLLVVAGEKSLETKDEEEVEEAEDVNLVDLE